MQETSPSKSETLVAPDLRSDFSSMKRAMLPSFNHTQTTSFFIAFLIPLPVKPLIRHHDGVECVLTPGRGGSRPAPAPAPAPAPTPARTLPPRAPPPCAAAAEP